MERRTGGRETPPDHLRRISQNITIPQWLSGVIREIAQTRGPSFSGLVSDILESWVRKHHPDRLPEGITGEDKSR